MYLIFFWIFVIILLLYLSGAQVNWLNRQISPTATISLTTIQKKRLAVSYSLNGTKADVVVPTTIDHLTPGSYSLTITAPGMVPWQQNVTLDDYEAKSFPLLLVKEQIVERPANTQEMLAFSLVKKLVSPGLLIRDNELIDITGKDGKPERLIVRLSAPIEQAIWWAGDEHIMLRVGHDIMLVESTGTNITKITTLAEDQPELMMSWDKGRTLVVQREKGISSFDLY